jgi:hypothetical protein
MAMDAQELEDALYEVQNFGWMLAVNNVLVTRALASIALDRTRLQTFAEGHEDIRKAVAEIKASISRDAEALQSLVDDLFGRDPADWSLGEDS